MNLYLTVFLLLAAAALAEWKKPGRGQRLYPACWAMLTFLLCLRFGQGTDYASYHAIYDSIPLEVHLDRGDIFGFYPEIGWRLATVLFKLFHIPFPAFTMALGLADMLLLHRFLQKYVPMRVVGLFLSWPVLYFTYMVSGLRQGLAICLFLGLAFPFYMQKRWIPYVLCVCAAASFHKAGFLWLLLAAVSFLPVKAMGALTALSILGGFILRLGIVQGLLLSLLPSYHLQQLLEGGAPSLFALAERLVSFALLAALYAHSARKEEEKPFLKAYMCGVCIYMLFFFNAYYASRFGALFKVLECALVVRLAEEGAWRARIAVWFFFALALLMGAKNLQAAAVQGGYTEKQVNLFTYPYVSVFNPGKIEDYYDYTGKREGLYQDILIERSWMLEE